MSGARVRFLLLSLAVLAVPVLVWWDPIREMLGGDAAEPAPPSWAAIDFGDRPEAFALEDLHGGDVTLDVRDGTRPTVVYFWSAFCPCIDDCEGRIQAMQKRFPKEKVRIVAVSPNPDDLGADLDRERKRLRVTYPILRDPSGRTPYRLGVLASASVAIFDAEGRLRYRGAIDDDIERPTVSYLEQVLAALLEGREPERTSATPYGCQFPPLE